MQRLVYEYSQPVNLLIMGELEDELINHTINAHSAANKL